MHRRVPRKEDYVHRKAMLDGMRALKKRHAQTEDDLARASTEIFRFALRHHDIPQDAQRHIEPLYLNLLSSELTIDKLKRQAIKDNIHTDDYHKNILAQEQASEIISKELAVEIGRTMLVGEKKEFSRKEATKRGRVVVWHYKELIKIYGTIYMEYATTSRLN